MNPPVDTTRFLILGTAAVFLPLSAWTLLLAVRIRRARIRLRNCASGGSPVSYPEKSRNGINH